MSMSPVNRMYLNAGDLIEKLKDNVIKLEKVKYV